MTVGKLDIVHARWRNFSFSAFWFFLALNVIAASPVRAQQVLTPATIAHPSEGAFFDPGQAISWSEQPGALAYYLYVGTAPGLKDIIDSGETLSTDWPGIQLPAGATVYATLHTKYAAGWVYSESAFTVQPIAVLTSPTASESVVNPIHRFEWATVPGAEAYYLYVGTAPGLKDLVNTGEIQSNSFLAPNLPSGKTIYVRVHAKYDGVWRSFDKTLNVLPIATFITPTDDALGIDPESELRWRDVDGAEAYYLYVGTEPGLKDLVNTGEILETSWPAKFIPAGETVHARLHTKVNGFWWHTDISFQLAPKSVFIEPSTEGDELDPRAPLLWTEVRSALAYYLYVGSTPGAKDIVNSGEIQALSFDISTLPRGQTLYATLSTKSSDGWRRLQRSFRIVGVVATLAHRSDAPSNIDVRNPIQWIGAEGAEAYRLVIGTNPGSNDLIDSGETLATQHSIDNLPSGQTVYIRLYTKHGGIWRHVDATYSTRAVAYLQGPVADSGVLQPTTPLSWSAIPGADAYFVYVGSSPGSKDISQSGAIPGTEFILPPSHAAAIGSDRTIYIRLHTLKDGSWRYVDYTLQFKVAASLTFPVPNASDVDVTSLRLTWYGVDDATRYRLQLGTSLGAEDILSTPDMHTLSSRVNALPGGKTIFVRLWTEISGEWRYSDSSFSTRPAATLLQPRFGQTNVDVGSNLILSAVENASMYRVEFGSFQGSNDIFDSGTTSATSIQIPATLPQSLGTIYARVWTRYEDAWRYTDSLFSLDNPEPVAMEWASSSDAFRARDAFRWTGSPLIEAYHLRIGTSAGSNNLHDSGSIRTTRRLVDDLPENVQLFGSLEAMYYDGSTEVTSFQFTIENASIEYDDRWVHALWMTGEVRRMADDRNVALPNSVLQDFVRAQNRETAYCTAYALALVDFSREVNLGLEIRQRSVCLNPNRYDCHTFNEALNPATGRWQLLDPTFGMAMRHSTTGEWLTVMDMFESTRDGTFNLVEYVPQTDAGLSYAEGYYLDYPLLFAKVYESGSNQVIANMGSVLHFFDLPGTNTVSASGLYAIHCLGSDNSVLISINEVPTSISCRADADDLSHVFSASNIGPIENSPPFEIAIPRRIVFQ